MTSFAACTPKVENLPILSIAFTVDLVVYSVMFIPIATTQLWLNPAFLPLKPPPRCKLLVMWAKCLLKGRQGEPRKRSTFVPSQVSGF